MTRLALITLVTYILSGCAYYMTPRPPLAERKLGDFGDESIGALATAPDYRVIFVKLHNDAVMCAEAPADVAAHSAANAAVTAALADKGNVNVSAAMTVAMKQLFFRTQGLSLVRDAGFLYCNMYMNGALQPSEYVSKMDDLVRIGADLIKAQLPHLGVPGYDPVAVPTVPSDATKPSAAKPEAGK